MHAFLLSFLALAADSNSAPHSPVAEWQTPAGESFVGEAAGNDMPVPLVERAGPVTVPVPGLGLAESWGSMPASTSWGWPRVRRGPRLLPPKYPANPQYYQSHPYDPRLMFDYPWHAPRVSQPVGSVFPSGDLAPSF